VKRLLGRGGKESLEGQIGGVRRKRGDYQSTPQKDTKKNTGRKEMQEKKTKK